MCLITINCWIIPNIVSSSYFSPDTYICLNFPLYQAKPMAEVRFDSNKVLKWWHHKNDFSEIMGFIRLFGTTYLKTVHTHTQNWSALNSWDIQIASY